MYPHRIRLRGPWTCEPLWRWQDGSGGFPYRTDSPTGGMTAATLGGFAVLAELGKGNARVEELLGKKRHDLQRAETWLEARFEALRS